MGSLAAPAVFAFPSASEAAAEKFDLQAYLEEQSPKTRANWHMGRLAEALYELYPGYWHSIPSIDPDVSFVLIQRDPVRSKTISGVQTNFIL